MRLRLPGRFFYWFHTPYILVNIYVFARLFGLFRIRRPFLLVAVILVSTFSFRTAGLAYYDYGPSLYPLYYAAVMWFGVVWFLFWCLLVSEVPRLLVRGLNLRYIGIVVIVVAALASICAGINATRLCIVTRSIHAPVDLRLVQISDLHLGASTPGYARKVVDAVNALNPDAVLICGDTIDTTREIGINGLEPFRGLKAPVFAVTGNHEPHARLDMAVAAMRSVGFHVLRGDTVDFKGIRIIGFDDDPAPSAIKTDLAGVKIDQSAFNVLLFHRPDGLPDAAHAGIDLMLAGHTHGGQLFPFTLIMPYRYHYPYGLYHLDGATLNTTQGIGTWGPRMRLGTTPEIVVLDLSRSAGSP
jgi:uncharacterized protein